MSKETGRLLKLMGDMDKPSAKPAKSRKAAGAVDPNPPKGEKGDFLKVTVSLSPEIYELLGAESTRRKTAKEKDSAISAIIREAVVEKLTSSR